MVSARQLHVDVANSDGALFVAGTAALVLTVVITAFLHPAARFRTVDRCMKTIWMALVDTRVTAWKSPSAKNIAPGLW